MEKKSRKLTMCLNSAFFLSTECRVTKVSEYFMDEIDASLSSQSSEINDSLAPSFLCQKLTRGIENVFLFFCSVRLQINLIVHSHWPYIVAFLICSLIPHNVESNHVRCNSSHGEKVRKKSIDLTDKHSGKQINQQLWEKNALQAKSSNLVSRFHFYLQLEMNWGHWDAMYLRIELKYFK